MNDTRTPAFRVGQRVRYIGLTVLPVERGTTGTVAGHYTTERGQMLVIDFGRERPYERCWPAELEPVEPLPTGWSKLAEPTYAVSRDGEARRLEAGTYLAPLAPDQRDGRLPVLEVQVWTEPEWPYYERPVSFWFVHGPALRFGEVA